DGCDRYSNRGPHLAAHKRQGSGPVSELLIWERRDGHRSCIDCVGAFIEQAEFGGHRTQLPTGLVTHVELDPRHSAMFVYLPRVRMKDPVVNRNPGQLPRAETSRP